ncbi:MAG: hypothetical protein QM739_07680 [Propionivibrio sp.]
MFHLLPFAVGLLAGAVTVKMVKNDQTKKQLEKAQASLKKATVSSLNVIEQSSARLRSKLAEQAAVPAAVIADAPTPAKAPRKRAPASKAAAKPAKAPAKQGGAE